MKIEPSKEWCERSAEIEGDSEVGSGVFPASDCSPLDDATREEVIAMVFDPKNERASVGMIWEQLRRKYGALLPAECLIYYEENAKHTEQP